MIQRVDEPSISSPQTRVCKGLLCTDNELLRAWSCSYEEKALRMRVCTSTLWITKSQRCKHSRSSCRPTIIMDGLLVLSSDANKRTF